MNSPANRPLLSLSMRAANPEQGTGLLLNPLASIFNSPGNDRLPPFFQNLLPEGVLRKHIAAERGCDENDYFELLAACGADLPGNVSARPTKKTRDLARKLVTQNHDALEESVIADPLEDGVSLSGIQPKLALVAEGGRFVTGGAMETAISSANDEPPVTATGIASHADVETKFEHKSI